MLGDGGCVYEEEGRSLLLIIHFHFINDISAQAYMSKNIFISVTETQIKNEIKPGPREVFNAGDVIVVIDKRQDLQ